jgi:hypothetical protein
MVKKGPKFDDQVNLFIYNLAQARRLFVELIAYFTPHVITCCRPGHSCQHLTEEGNKQQKMYNHLIV